MAIENHRARWRETARAAALYERLAGELERSARLADVHADAVRLAGDEPAEAHERDVAARARSAARRARALAFRLRSDGPHCAP